MDQDTYEKKVELIDESFEFAMSQIWQLQVDSMPCRFINKKAWKTRFSALEESMKTMKNVAIRALRKQRSAERKYLSLTNKF